MTTAEVFTMQQTKAGWQQPDFQTLLEGQQDLICRFHKHELQPHQCGSILLQQIQAPVDIVWSFTRRFAEPQMYKRLIQGCDLVEGDGGVGSVRELHMVSSIPATSSKERLEILNEEEHIISFRVLEGNHRLQNYWSITSLHPHEINGQMGTLVLESYIVDIPDGNTREETHMFVDTIVRCNLKVLTKLSEHKYLHELQEAMSSSEHFHDLSKDQEAMSSSEHFHDLSKDQEAMSMSSSESVV